jgi:hypothetical protein
MSDLGQLLGSFRSSAFRLETLQVYSVPQEAEMIAAFRRGETVKPPDGHPWLKRVREATITGRQMQRVRIVSYPLSEYVRFEMSLYPHSVASGEDIRIAEACPELEACNRDFWLFDDSIAVVLEYDNDGRFLGAEATEHVVTYRQQRDLALSRSMELSAYTARAARG